MPALVAPLATVLAGTRWQHGVAGEAVLPDGSIYRCQAVTPGLILVIEGRVAWTIDGRKMQVEAPALLLMPGSGCEERRYLGPQRHLYLGLRQTAKAITTAAPWAGRPWRLDAETPATGLMRLAVVAGLAGETPTVEAHLRSLLAMVISGRWTAPHSTDQVLPEPLQRMIRHVQACWQHSGARPLLLSELASASGLTPTSLCRLCRHHLGHPPIALERLLRARLAVHRLRHGRQAVKRIAAECGFCSARHLATVLRQLYGHGPRELREHLDLPTPAPAGMDWLVWNEPPRV